MGIKNQMVVYEYINIFDDQEYEWVRFFKGEVYESDRFRITGSHTRTTITPKLHPPPSFHKKTKQKKTRGTRMVRR